MHEFLTKDTFDRDLRYLLDFGRAPGRFFKIDKDRSELRAFYGKTDENVLDLMYW